MIRRFTLSLAVAAALSAASAATLPRQAPDLTIHLNGGKSIQVGSYKGKAVVLAFILTTCSHCQATTGLLGKAQNDYGPRGLQVLESAIDQGAEAFVPRFIQQFGPPFPVGFNDFNTAQDFMQHSPMLIMHMPGVVFIDRSGRIVAQYEGDDPDMMTDQEKHLRERIEQLLKPAGAATTAKKSVTKK
jgi:cytochrome oxidase Cu insertion factor (SCO1/SenC/PrrC family)